MNETIDAEFRETSSTLAVVEQPPSAAPALFGTTDPVAIVTNAVRVADALKAVVVSKNLISNIQGKAYPQVEAWLTLAAMLRLTTVCEWSRRVESGWEARVFVRDANGATVGAAEAQCLGTERTKKSWEDYALRSMAQTRATSKALRSVLGFVMVLAGYEATPSEEMPGDTTAPPPAKDPPRVTVRDVVARAAKLKIVDGNATFEEQRDELRKIALAEGATWTVQGVIAWLDARVAPDAVRGASDAQRKMAMAIHAELGHSDTARHALYESRYGVRSFNDLNVAQATDLIDFLNRSVDAKNASD